MSRLVLVGASFGKLSQKEIDNLLGCARQYGIWKIDTAPGYGDSEKKIGNYQRRNPVFSVNTKVGLPDPSIFIPFGIRKSVENGLRDLETEQIDTIFVHTLNKSYLTNENIDSLLRLRDQGKVRCVGYSVDGDDLRHAIKDAAFDDLMLTFNIIDQANYDLVGVVKEPRELYFKVALAQAIWTGLRIDRRIASLNPIRTLFGKPPFPDSWLDYRMRFTKFKNAMLSKDYAAEFLRFALFSMNSNQFVVLGTTSPLHIERAVFLETQRVDSQQMSIYRELWMAKSSSEWLAHT